MKWLLEIETEADFSGITNGKAFQQKTFLKVYKTHLKSTQSFKCYSKYGEKPVSLQQRKNVSQPNLRTSQIQQKISYVPLIK